MYSVAELVIAGCAHSWRCIESRSTVAASKAASILWRQSPTSYKRQRVKGANRVAWVK